MDGQTETTGAPAPETAPMIDADDPRAKGRKVLAIASGGGHWVQLRRMRGAWAGCRVAYVTTQQGYRAEVLNDPNHIGPAPAFHVVPDANRWQKFRLLRQLLAIAGIVVAFRPDVVITTGAAPGYFAIRVAKLLGAKTIWIDSIANGDELSLAGRKAGRHADLFLTQWPHLARPEGPQHLGSVL